MHTGSFLCFLVLQGCDFATTLCFLDRGVAEGNPVVGAALHLSANPALPLVAVKLLGCTIGLLAWRLKRFRLLRAANWGFGLCVAWNLAAIASAWAQL